MGPKPKIIPVEPGIWDLRPQNIKVGPGTQNRILLTLILLEIVVAFLP